MLLITNTQLIHFSKTSNKKIAELDGKSIEEASKHADYGRTQTLSTFVGLTGAVKRLFKPEVYTLHKMLVGQPMNDGLKLRSDVAVKPYQVNGNFVSKATIIIQDGETLEEAIKSNGFDVPVAAVAVSAAWES